MYLRAMDPSKLEGKDVPLTGRIMSMILSLSATTILSLFLGKLENAWSWGAKRRG